MVLNQLHMISAPFPPQSGKDSTIIIIHTCRRKGGEGENLLYMQEFFLCDKLKSENWFFLCHNFKHLQKLILTF